MQLDHRFIRVGLSIDGSTLAAEIASLDPSLWRPHPEGHAGNDALPLVAAGGDPLDDRVDGDMEPCPVLDQLPYVRAILAAIGSPIGRTRLMRIVGNGEATAHVDTNRYWWDRYRVHFPVVTTPEVSFICGDESLHMQVGECWLFDTWSRHNVINPVASARIHLVVDTVGSDAFDALVASNEPQLVAVDREVAVAELTFERGRPNDVASVEQLSETAKALLAPCDPDAVRPVREAVDQLLGEWAGLHERQAIVAEYWDALARFSANAERSAVAVTLPNEANLFRALQQLVIFPGIRDERGAQAGGNRRPADLPLAIVDRPLAPTSSTSSTSGAASDAVSVPRTRFREPVIIASPPRAGSTMLFEMLAQSPSVWALPGESHREIEGIASLNPAARNMDSNRLLADDATTAVVGELERAFMASLQNRDGRRIASDATDIRLLEKTPKNALRIPFLNATFPDARYVYLAREPRDEISSMIDAWRSGRFVTYRDLPDWTGSPWSMVLVPGWRELNGRSLAEVVVHQWATTTSILLDDLEAIPADRWCVTRYEDLLVDPQTEIERICAFTGLGWDRTLNAGLLPLSRHTLTAPAADKWKRNWAEIEPLMPIIEPVAARVHDLFGELANEAPTASRRAMPLTTSAGASPAAAPRGTNPATAITNDRGETVDDSTTTDETIPNDGTEAVATSAPENAAAEAPVEPALPPFRSVHTTSMSSLVKQMASSVLVSTYQSGRVILLRSDDEGGLNTHFRPFSRPMGLAVGANGRLSIGTTNEVIEYRNQPAVAAKVEPLGKHDACYLPRRRHVTGDISIHDMSYAADGELWVVNTRFSCLATLDADHSFVPRWKPAFISALAAEDRCHLNGMAMVDGRPKYVTALGLTDTAAGWRENKAAGGILMDVESGEILLDGLSMPHSPRWYNGKLWLLESGRGGLGVVDLQKGTYEIMVRLPGFTRGLAFVGPYALVGLSQVRESMFGGLPLTESNDPRYCGVWVVDIRNGSTAGFLRFEGAVQEVFDVQILPGARYPELAELNFDKISGSFVVPDSALDGSIATALGVSV